MAHNNDKTLSIIEQVFKTMPQLLDEKNSVNRYFLDFWKKWEYSSYSSLVPFVSRFHARMKICLQKGTSELQGIF